MVAWNVDMAALTPSVLAMALTASEERLLRLQYVAFLRQNGQPGLPAAGRRRPVSGEIQKYAPSTVLRFDRYEWNKRFPRFERWRRRKARSGRLVPVLPTSLDTSLRGTDEEDLPEDLSASQGLHVKAEDELLASEL